MKLAAHALDAHKLDPVRLLSLSAEDFLIVQAVVQAADKLASDRAERQNKAMKSRRR